MAGRLLHRLRLVLTVTFTVVLLVLGKLRYPAVMAVAGGLAALLVVAGTGEGWRGVGGFGLILMGGGGTVLVVHAVGQIWRRTVAAREAAPLSWSAAGHPAAQEFRVPNPVANFLREFWWALPQLVVLFFIATFLGSIPFGEDGLVPGIAIGATATGILAFLTIVRKARRGFLSTVIRMSPTGVEVLDFHGWSTCVRWPDVTRVGPVVVFDSSCTGLVGWGERSFPGRLPAEQWESLNQPRRDPDSGAIEVAVPLGLLDRNWPSGPMGAWVRRYRPGLLTVALDGIGPVRQRSDNLGAPDAAQARLETQLPAAPASGAHPGTPSAGPGWTIFSIGQWVYRWVYRVPEILLLASAVVRGVGNRIRERVPSVNSCRISDRVALVVGTAVGFFILGSWTELYRAGWHLLVLWPIATLWALLLAVVAGGSVRLWPDVANLVGRTPAQVREWRRSWSVRRQILAGIGAVLGASLLGIFLYWLLVDRRGFFAILPAALVLAVTCWAAVLLDRRTRPLRSPLFQRMPEALAVIPVAFVMHQAFRGGNWSTNVVIGALLPVGFWLAMRLWRAMSQATRLLIRAAADIVFSLSLGAMFVLTLVWVAHAFDLSPPRVQAVRAMLESLQDVASVPAIVWVASYLVLAVASFLLLLRPFAASVGEPIRKLLFGRIPVVGTIRTGHRVVNGVSIVLMVALSFGLSAPGVLAVAAHDPIETRYALEVRRQQAAEQEAAAYRAIMHRFAVDPPRTRSLRAMVVAIHRIDPPSSESAGATETGMQVARQVGRFQVHATREDVGRDEPDRFVERDLPGEDLGEQLAALDSQQRRTATERREVNRFASLAAAAVAATIDLPDIGDREIMQLIRSYLGGLLEDGPLTRVFAGIAEKTSRQPALVDEVVVPEPHTLYIIALTQYIEASTEYGVMPDFERLPETPTELLEDVAASGMSDVVELANSVRYLRHGTGPCKGCKLPEEPIPGLRGGRR